MDILLVDDDREVLAAIGAFLKDRGHRLATELPPVRPAGCRGYP